MTDTLYDYDTDSAQCAYCFGQAPCGYDHTEEEDGLEGFVPDHIEPGEVLNLLETAEGPRTAMELSAETGYLVESIETELRRLEAKGLVHLTETRRWADRLRSV